MAECNVCGDHVDDNAPRIGEVESVDEEFTVFNGDNETLKYYCSDCYPGKSKSSTPT